MTDIVISRVRFIIKLKYGLYSLIVTFCAKPVKWLGIIVCSIAGIDKHLRRDFTKRILRFFLFPCFDLHEFLAKHLIFLQQRMILSLHRHNPILEANDGIV